MLIIHSPKPKRYLLPWQTRPPWFRRIPWGGFIWQTVGAGGSTLHYLANSPRAFLGAIDMVWPISYKELIPYYEKVEATLPVNPAPMTDKEVLFFYGDCSRGKGQEYLDRRIC